VSLLLLLSLLSLLLLVLVVCAGAAEDMVAVDVVEPPSTSPEEVLIDSSAARPDAISWDDYFMSVAFLTAMRSKDPSTQVGAVIVNNLKRIIGVGYNGFPTGCSDDVLPWAKTSPKGELETKYPYVVHAELNAVMNKNSESCIGCRLYSTLFPCNECAKVIIQAGIREVIYASDKQKSKDSARASRKLFKLAGVEMRHFVSKDSSLNLVLRYPEDEPGPHPMEQTPVKIRKFMTGAYSGCDSCANCGSPPTSQTSSSSQRFAGWESFAWSSAAVATAMVSLAVVRSWQRRGLSA